MRFTGAAFLMTAGIIAAGFALAGGAPEGARAAVAAGAVTTFAVTVAAYAALCRVLARRREWFPQAFIGAVGLKMLVFGMVIAVVWGGRFLPLRPFALAALAGYLPLLGLEVGGLLRRGAVPAVRS